MPLRATVVTIETILATASRNMISTEHKYVERRACKRVVPMQVLVLGLGRTGTESIRKALVHLGYDGTYHGYTAAVESPLDCVLWLEALAGKFDKTREQYDIDDWDNLLGNYQAVCDIPAVCFAEELIRTYPNAKVILSNRHVDIWHASVKTALLANMFNWWVALVDFLAWLTRSRHRFARRMFIKAFDSYFGDFEKNGKAVFEEHYSMVRRLCGEKHLEYSVEEGWEPLCRFLGKEVPQIPFPNGNARAETTARIQAIVGVEVRRLIRLASWMAAAMVFILVVAWALLVSLRFG
ncbi:uncharacterized protein Z518_08918 [Rhinocladiella mackenziei CBS 650.93]|uniref:Rhinocladiella mackenziei CBS 650.93 unplaced genomic scaffold supercont1.7, whole genome shotgun sequence n=1 Tax=Rhinocladiella mackenziei CBS 650.93 TaxID=1442369 RepID=A0A0D2GS85_9EURO|nr:uncharacterized protein Z518_08918 [Rhinocladiella mackenziei CBS 650.93]KIX01193.1 hypothetical protein Z518_08918 [Rhinocladiella mackenziei CBS 650.93]